MVRDGAFDDAANCLFLSAGHGKRYHIGGDYQICMDFVANIFDFCLEKLNRDKKNENKILYEDLI